MAQTNDSFGNYFLGNYISGDAFSYASILSCLQSSLGSSARATLTTGRIDWRPNITEETLTSAVAGSGYGYTNVSGGGNAVSTNARSAFSFSSSGDTVAIFGISGQSGYTGIPNLTSAWTIWAVSNERSFNLFAKNGAATFFFSQGFLLNNSLTFPYNAYYLAGNSAYIQGYTANNSGAVAVLQTYGSIANYAHNKLNGSATFSEVELSVRNASSATYGYAPNLFLWKQDNGEATQAIGDIVKLNLANATGYYAGRGNILCMVVCKLGNATNTDAGGDYLLMPIKY